MSDVLLPGTEPTCPLSDSWLALGSSVLVVKAAGTDKATEPPHLGFPRGSMVRMGEASMAFPGPQLSVFTLSGLVKPLRYFHWFNEI